MNNSRRDRDLTAARIAAMVTGLAIIVLGVVALARSTAHF